MSPADFTYSNQGGPQGLAFAVSIFGDRAHQREQMQTDATAAGFAVRECAPVGALLEGDPRPLGEVVLVDCPRIDAAVLAALARLDARVARAGAHLVISTSVAALEDVFACCDQSAPQILVDPSRAERALALERIAADMPRPRLREPSPADRFALLRLTEQVRQIAQRLEGIGQQHARISDEADRFRVKSPARSWQPPADDSRAKEPGGASNIPLLDSEFLRRIIRHRQLRSRYFEGELFTDPAWDILLDLAAARAENAQVSVTSLCIASGVPPTTALRWIGLMTEAGLLERVKDQSDRRRVFIALSDRAAQAMASYFDEVGADAAQLV